MRAPATYAAYRAAQAVKRMDAAGGVAPSFAAMIEGEIQATLDDASRFVAQELGDEASETAVELRSLSPDWVDDPGAAPSPGTGTAAEWDNPCKSHCACQLKWAAGYVTACSELRRTGADLAAARERGTHWENEFNSANHEAARLIKDLADSGEGRRAALADAAALRERVEGLEATDRVREYTIRSVSTQRDEARALALTNGAEVERLEALFQQTHGVHHSWVAKGVKAEAERDELRGLLERFVAMTPRSLDLGRLPFAEWHDYARAWLASHPAIPEAEAKPKGTR